jgi:hypothetical protein
MPVGGNNYKGLIAKCAIANGKFCPNRNALHITMKGIGDTVCTLRLGSQLGKNAVRIGKYVFKRVAMSALTGPVGIPANTACGSWAIYRKIS